MSETEDLSNEGEEENEELEVLLVKEVLKIYFLSDACSNGIACCCQNDTSANIAKISFYNDRQVGANDNLPRIMSGLFDEATMSRLEDEVREEVKHMCAAMNDEAETIGERIQAAEHEEPPTEQMQSATASVSSDGDTSAMSGTSTEAAATAAASSGRREREPNENEDSHNPRHQQRRRLNNHATSPSTSIVGPPPGAATATRSRGEAVVYDEEEVKLQVRNDIEKIKSAFESLNHEREDPIGVGSDSLLLQMVACTLMGKIRSGENLLQSISSSLQNLLCVCEGTYRCRERLVNVLQGEATTLQTLPKFDSTASIGSLLALSSKNSSIDETTVLSNVSQMSGADEVRHIDSIEKNMATELLKAYSVNDQSHTNLLQILGNVLFGSKLYSLLLMSQIFKYLRDEFALTAKAKELHMLKCNTELGGSTTVLDFVETVLLPLSIIQEHKLEAVKFLLVIKDVTTNFSANRVTRELQSSRKQILHDVAARVLSMDINGNVASGSGGEDYPGNAEGAFDEPIKDAVNAVFNLLMANEIESKLPPQLFASRGGFALGILRLSASNMTRTCSKFTPEFLFGTSREDGQTADALRHVYSTDDKKLTRFKETILKEKYKTGKSKNDTSFRGEKKIVIFTAAQMKSFEALGDFAFA